MFHKRYPPVGSLPGAFAVDTEAVETRICLIDYSADELKEFDVIDIECLTPLRTTNTVSWIDVKGLGNPDLLHRLGEMFDIHPLAMADVVNVPGRPKVEEYDTFVLIIGAMVDAPSLPEINVEQVSVILGKHFVITFQEDYEDVLEPVRERLRLSRGIIRKNGPDYLAYAILDALIDGYFPVLESLGEYLEDLEVEVIERPTKQVVRQIYHIKRELLKLRRSIWPQREALHSLTQGDSTFFRKGVRVYLRDCYDHCVQIIDVIETFRELCGSFTDIYLSSISNRLNEVMKVLTVISTIFIPLSFFSSVYGMNFKYFPELEWRYGYFLFWFVAISVAGSMLYYFRKNGWLGGQQVPEEEALPEKS